MKLSRSLIPDATALQAFEAAARHESFTRAALELDLTQSAISRQIKDLERQLGLQLFDRVRQRVVLSAAGRRLLPEAERLLAQIEQMALGALAARDRTGLLTLATLPTFGSRWLMPRLPGFLQAHPGLQVTVISRSDPFDLAAAGVDLAIHYGKPIWPNAACRYLCSEEVVPVAGAGLARDFAGDAAALARLPLLHLQARPRLWSDWLEGQGIGTEGAYSGHRFDQFALVIEAAVAGLGVALVPRYLIEQDLAAGRLRVMLEASLRLEPSYYVVLPEGKIADPLCEAFQDWLLGQVRRPEDLPQPDLP